MAPSKRYKPDFVRAAFKQWFVGEEGGDGEQRAYCPVCEDPNTSHSPSAMFNAETGIWNCLKGNHGGSIWTLARDLKRETGFDVRAAAMRTRNQEKSFTDKRDEGLARAGKAAAPLPSEDRVTSWTQRLLKDKAVLAKFTSERGISKATIIEFGIGWDGQRFTFPIYDRAGELVNVRRYKMNASAQSDKMLNIPGHGTAHIYGEDMLADNDEIVLTEGETDRIVLCQTGIPAVTHTAGAGTFRPQWARQFEGKTVYVAYDNDDSGKKGRSKVQAILEPVAEAVYFIDIPLAHKGADVTDYIVKEGHSREEFLLLMKEARERDDAGVAAAKLPIPTEGRKTSLQESMSQDLQNEILELTVSVAGKQAEPFTAPRRIEINCDMSKGAACANCPVSFKDGAMEVEIRADDEDLFRFVDVTEQRRKTLLKEVSGARCSDRAEFTVPEDYHIEELLVQQSVDEVREDEEDRPVTRTVYSVATYRSDVNEKVRLVGRNTADPKSGRLRFVAWKNDPVEMDIDQFKFTPEVAERLAIFRPGGSQSPLDKAMSIAQDLADNVTHIYGREYLHVAYDLVWHSVLSFQVGDMTVPKGWLEMMVVGDTRTGKSEIATRLIKHYRTGKMLSCEGMSFAGIVGGVQQIDNRWHMTWGLVPMNDRRMVILDEVSGMADKNVIEQMSSIRSSGVAQITKIQSQQASARVRTAWITNPADGSMIGSQRDGAMAALRTVVPNNEDIARFDFVCSAAKGEVADDVINSAWTEHSSPIYKSALCEELVKWAWSLKRSDVVISKLAARQAIDSAKDLGSRYLPDPPLIQSENVRFKLLRIAAALAARTFSADDRGRLMVNREHVLDAVRFLDLIYGMESMGYTRKSKRSIQDEERARERRSAVMEWLRERENDVLLTLQMVGGNSFKTRDFREFAGMDEADAQKAVKRLLNWRMIKIKSRGELGINPELASILRQLADEDDV